MLKKNDNFFDPFVSNLNIKKNIVSIIFIFDQQNRVLMQLRDNKPEISCPNMWGPVGGHCKKLETSYECCLRELKEETGYTANNINWYKNFFIESNKLINNKEHYVSIFWTDYDIKQKIKCYEGQEMRFLYLAELERLNTLRHNISWISDIISRK